MDSSGEFTPPLRVRTFLALCYFAAIGFGFTLGLAVNIIRMLHGLG
jgi:hypothetical protein